MTHLAVAALQLELSGDDNVDLMIEEIDRVARRFPWVQMVVLAELNVRGPQTALATALPDAVEGRFREAARRNRVWLIPGSMFERDGDRIYNTSPVIDPRGEIVLRYRKQFPFCPYEQGVTPGDSFAVFDVPGAGRIGLMICYDMWFPETVRTLAWMGAEVVLCPTMTNTIDRGVEVAIARSNAATNQLHFVSVNAAGRYGVGQSVVVGPDGAVIHQAGTGREVIAVDLDIGQVRRVRERGMHGLGQTLKSFRDSRLTFAPYSGGRSESLDRLGPLGVPQREDGE
jgi:deaminated glutathione amidase